MITTALIKAIQWRDNRRRLGLELRMLGLRPLMWFEGNAVAQYRIDVAMRS